MNRYLLIGLILAALLAFIWFTIWSVPIRSSTGESTQKGVATKSLKQQRAETSESVHIPSPVTLPRVGMKNATNVPDLIALARLREDAPFRCLGGSGTGRVVDQEDKVIMESGQEIGILGVIVGPDRQLVLVEGGDSINIVINPASGRKVKLPVYPPGEHMLGLGGWHWIGSRTLLGSSGIQALDENGVPVKSDNNVAQTKLYVYDVTTQRLSEVVMPSKVTQPLVNVMDVSPDGHVHLVQENSNGSSEQDLGWFKIDAPE